MLGCDKPQENAFVMACYHGRLTLVKAMVEKGADPNSQNNEGLFLAILCRHYDVAKYLLSLSSLQPSDTIKHGNSHLTMAIFRSEWEMVLLLVAHPSVQVTDDIMYFLLEADPDHFSQLLEARPAFELDSATVQTLKEENNLMLDALRAKFSTHPNLRAILVATGSAELWHGAGWTPNSRQLLLEQVRDELRRN